MKTDKVTKTLSKEYAYLECNPKNWTALILAVRNNSIRMVTILLNAGSDINARDSLGNTALTYAGLFGYKGLVEVLLARGADKNTVNNYGHTLLNLLEAEVALTWSAEDENAERLA